VTRSDREPEPEGEPEPEAGAETGASREPGPGPGPRSVNPNGGSELGSAGEEGETETGTGTGTRTEAGTGSGVRGPNPLWALRGAFGFLTRLPLPSRGAKDWDAFRRSPWTFPVVGALVGGVAGVAFLLPLPWPTAVAAYLAALYLLSGVTHPDGLADLGDAAAVHDPDRRLEVMRDAGTGVGGLLAVTVTTVVLALGGVGLATAAAGLGVAFRLALAAEVGAKLGMATLVCLGDPAHEGLGSQLVGAVGAASLVPAAVVAAAVLVAPPPGGLPALLAALLAPVGVALVLLWRTREPLGGVSGDVIGAGNELGRAVALHAAAVAWLLPWP